MRKILTSLALAAFFSFSLFLCKAETSDVVLKAPSETKIGRPFLARLEPNGRTLSEVTISWFGEQAPLEPDEDGIYSALLGTDVQKAQPGERELSVTFRTGFFNRQTTLYHTVKLLPHDYPVEKLTVEPSKASPPQKESERIAREAKLSREALFSTYAGRAPTLPLERPVNGIYTSHYGKTRWFNGKLSGRHGGADMRARIGTPVKAAADGVVALTGDFYFSGRCVYLSHGAGLTTLYLHLSEVKVKEGEEVKRGQVIGLSGNTGRVTGPHLHFATVWRGIYFDPAPLLPDPK